MGSSWGRAVFCLCLLTGALIPEPTASAQAPVTTITVDLSRPTGSVDRHVLGVNHRYTFGGFGMWDADTRAPAPGFLEEFIETGFRAVRFPGGLVANNYHWERAIGEVEQRGLNIAGIEGGPVTNEFGPDEFGALIDGTGAEGTIVVNASTAGPREAAAWVEYMNTPAGPGNPLGGVDWAEVRAANGHPAPYGIHFWEVGNEPWHPRQKYWMNKARGDRLARMYAFGGTTTFYRQPVALESDYRPSAAISTGEPNQVVTVRFPPVTPGDLKLRVGGSKWRRVGDLDGAGSGPVFELDEGSGRITFGDGVTGAIPERDARITVSYSSGPHAGYVGFRRMMRRVDPTIEVGSALSRIEFVHAMGTKPYDFVVMHLRGGHLIPVSDISTVHDEVMLEPAKQSQRVVDLREEIRLSSGRSPEDMVAVTEWGPHRALARNADRFLISLDSALYSALELKEWIEIDVPLAQRHTLIDFPPGDNELPSFGHPDEAVMGPAPRFVTSATQLVFSLFARVVDETVVASEVVGNPLKLTSSGQPLTALEVLATSDVDATHVLVINRDYSTDVEARIDLGPDGPNAGEVNFTELNAGSILAYNTQDQPESVRLATSTIQFDGTELVHTFPAHSVTLVTLAR